METLNLSGRPKSLYQDDDDKVDYSNGDVTFLGAAKIIIYCYNNQDYDEADCNGDTTFLRAARVIITIKMMTRWGKCNADFSFLGATNIIVKKTKIIL